MNIFGPRRTKADRVVRASLSLALLAIAFVSVGAGDPPEDRPRDVGVVEEAQVRRIQLDVTVSGPPEAVESLSREDFDLTIAGRDPPFEVDSLCETPPEGMARRSIPRPATYLFYFDQPHLTPQGRHRSIEMAREIVSSVIRDGAQGTVVSNAREIETYVELSPNPEEVLAALDRLERDPAQRETFAALEEIRVAQLEETIVREIRHARMERALIERRADPRAQAKAKALAGRSSAGLGKGPDAGESLLPSEPPSSSLRSDEESLADILASGAMARIRNVARELQAEELWIAQRDFTRLALILARLAERDPPKVALYFGDTLRANAGQHYLDLIGIHQESRELGGRGLGARETMRELPRTSVAAGAGESPSDTAWLSPGGFDAAGSFDRVIREAGSQGVRLYTVEAQGLVANFGRSTRMRDSQGTLKGLALESGGQAFLNASTAEQVAGSILDDLSCLYLLTVDPAELPVDRLLTVRVRVDRPGVTTRARGRLVVPSDEARRQSRLLTAFAAPGSGSDDLRVRADVIPTGYDGDAFRSLLQVRALAPEGAPSADWEIGASVVAKGAVRQEASGRVSVGGTGIPVVLQTPVDFGSGAYEIVAVAREVLSDRVASRRVDGAWPDPKGDEAEIGEVTVVQPERAVFVQDGEVSHDGFVVRGRGDPVRIDAPTALLAVVCRGRGRKETIRAERRVEGETETPFPPMELDLREERCGLIRDVIPAGMLGEGYFAYEIRVLRDEDEVARRAVEFAVASVGPPGADPEP